jgi:hypothetical protein
MVNNAHMFILQNAQQVAAGDMAKAQSENAEMRL